MHCLFLMSLVPLASAVSLFTLDNDLGSQEMFSEWNDFKQAHDKKYETEEEEDLRFYIFQANRRLVDSHNEAFQRGEHGFSLELNQFADLLPSEFAAQRLGFEGRRPAPETAGSAATFLRLPAEIELPAAVDWRTVGAVSAVQDQGRCGSCWAFSANGALEGQHFRKTGRLVNLSEQNLIDCAGPYGAYGCEGGRMRAAFAYVHAQGGVDTEAAYPYEADDDNACRFSAAAAAVGATDVGSVALPSGDEQALKEAVAVYGPVSVAIDASRPTFQFYGGGVYDDPACSAAHLNHAVLAVGYGTDEHGRDFWLVKNSWSDRWGEHGYVRIARNHNACGVANNAVFPLV
ncbi:Cathepsin L [Amphibalanus amphitrite]|uniref:Cathepsin L n=1 Tax=Amphibalanus amphitrite TaxID=1232801 RepID=A0A6A4WQ46_AMPAM|nr:Cathepsin L [Amphibalanus amphitrite]